MKIPPKLSHKPFVINKHDLFASLLLICPWWGEDVQVSITKMTHQAVMGYEQLTCKYPLSLWPWVQVSTACPYTGLLDMTYQSPQNNGNGK